MARCVVVIDGVVYVDGVRQEWTLPESKPELSEEEIERRLAAIYGTGEKGES